MNLLAEIDWLSITINLLLVFFVIVCLLMVLLVLMQRPKQEGLGAAFGSAVTDQVFGARTTNVLQRGTVILGSLFFILALTLACLIGNQNKKSDLLREQKAKSEEAAAPADKAAAPAGADAGLPASLEEAPPAGTATPPAEAPVAPEAPAAPAAPEVPADKPAQP